MPSFNTTVKGLFLQLCDLAVILLCHKSEPGFILQDLNIISYSRVEETVGVYSEL